MFGEDFDHEVRALSLGTKSCKELPNAQNNSHSFTLSDWLFTDSVFDTMYFFLRKSFQQWSQLLESLCLFPIKEKDKPLKSQYIDSCL